jgi:hypothetical protein
MKYYPLNLNKGILLNNMNFKHNIVSNDVMSLSSVEDILHFQPHIQTQHVNAQLFHIADNQTVISDITDNTDNSATLSNDFEEEINEIKTKLNSELNVLNVDNLRDKCKEIGISGIFKMKKPELIQTLENEFFKLVAVLKDKKANDLKNICKEIGIKGITGAKKDNLVCQILWYNLSVLKFRLNDEIKKEENIINVEQIKIIEQLEKQTQQIQLLEMKLKEEEEKKKMEEQKKKEEDEKKLKDDEEKKKKKDEKDKKKKEEEEQKKKIDEQNKLKEEEKKKKKDEKDKKKKEEEEQKKKEEEEQKKKEEEEHKKKLEEDKKKEAKSKKQNIPKNVRIIVWNHYIGEDIIKHKCLCCKKVTISNTNFEVGHVLSEKNGGSHEINNLRPICFSCNHSMGSENMIDFVVKYGLFIG